MKDNQCVSNFTPRAIGIVMKTTTALSLILISIDIMLLNGVFSAGVAATAVKNGIGTLNGLIFSFSSTLYVFKFNEQLLRGEVNLTWDELYNYYKSSDLRLRGLDILNGIEELDLKGEELIMFRDSILFRTKLKHFALVLEVLYFYFSAVAYAVMYYNEGRTEGMLTKYEMHLLNLYISVISPLISILFSYINVLCDNIIVTKEYVNAIINSKNIDSIGNVNKLLKKLRRVV